MRSIGLKKLFRNKQTVNFSETFQFCLSKCYRHLVSQIVLGDRMKTELKISLWVWQLIHMHGAKVTENNLIYQLGLLGGNRDTWLKYVRRRGTAIAMTDSFRTVWYIGNSFKKIKSCSYLIRKIRTWVFSVPDECLHCWSYWKTDLPLPTGVV